MIEDEAVDLQFYDDLTHLVVPVHRAQGSPFLRKSFCNVTFCYETWLIMCPVDIKMVFLLKFSEIFLFLNPERNKTHHVNY